MLLTKAFLKEMDDGKQWWQIVLHDANGEGKSYTAEVLFSKDRSSILRYREQFGDAEIQEKPVSKRWYTQPTQLTEESRKAAVSSENIEVTIPKGTYTANMLDFGVAPNVSLNIWQSTSEDIPGGILKYKTSNKAEFIYKAELRDFGSGRTTKLNSF